MAAAVAKHLVKNRPGESGRMDQSDLFLRRSQNIEQAEAILLKARERHPKNALIALNLACYASVMGRMEEAKVRLRHAIDVDKEIRQLSLDDEDLRPLWDWIGGVNS